MVELPLQDGHQGLVDERGLAAAAHAAHADESPQRELHVDVLEVVAAGAAQRQAEAVAAPAGRRDANRIVHRTGQAAVADVPALLARAGADVHDPVGRTHRLLVVLHHDDGVALVAQFLQRGEQLAVVALVQTDARLVQDIDDVHELGPDLRGQADALALAAGKRRRGPVQAQIVQAHVQQEADAVGKFLEDVAGHGARALVQLVRQGSEPGGEFADLHRAHLGDVLSVYAETFDMLSQARAVAYGAYHLVFDVAHHAVPVHHLRLGAVAHAVKLFRAEHQQAHGLVRQGCEGLIQREFVLARDGADQFELPPVPDAAQRGDTAVRDGLAPVGDDGVHTDVGHGAEALAVRAAAFRGVEGEGMRRRLLQGDAVFGIHQVFGVVVDRAGFEIEHRQRPAAHRQRRGHGTAHAGEVFVGGLEPVHHQFDEVGLVAVHSLYWAEVADLAVDAHLQVSLLPERLEQFAVVALAAAHQRGEQQALAAPVLLQDEVHDLGVGVAHHLLARHGRIGRGGAGIQQAQEIGDLRDGAHRRTRIAAGGLLLDGDDRAQPAHALHLRLLQDAHKVLGIGRERVHIAPLALRIQRVERQRGLAAAADSGDDHELAARNVHVHVLEVMGPGAAYFDLALFIHKG